MNKIFAILFLLFKLSGCVTKPSEPPPKLERGTKKARKKEIATLMELSGANFYIAKKTASVTYSLTNSPLSSLAVSKDQADKIKKQITDLISNPELVATHRLEALMATKHMTGASFKESQAEAKAILEFELKKNPQAAPTETVDLIVALAALRERRLAAAEYLLDRLIYSKEKAIQVAAYNAKGLIALKNDNVQQAKSYFFKALALDPVYGPARYNTAYLALSFGDGVTGDKLLGGMENDWFALYGLVLSARLMQEPKKAENFCRRLLQMQKDYKPGLFSCGLNDFQSLAAYSRAHARLTRMVKVEAQPTSLDERAFRILGDIDAAIAAQPRKKTGKKARKRSK